jgi:hypothetical protein
MPRKRNSLLNHDRRRELQSLINRGSAPTRQLTHAPFILKADEGEDAPSEASWADVKIADVLEINRPTVARVHERCVAENLEAALVHRPKNTKPKKLDGSREAQLITLSCSEPPRGKKRWSIGLWPSVS